MGTIVVGVEASPGSARALAWAVEEARLRQSVLEEEAFRNQAEQVLETLLDQVDGTTSGVDIRRTVVEDRNPAEALVELSAGADLLVVGSRGRGGFTELLLGSASHAVVLHAVCPVTVVPSRDAGRGGDSGSRRRPGTA